MKKSWFNNHLLLYEPYLKKHSFGRGTQLSMYSIILVTVLYNVWNLISHAVAENPSHLHMWTPIPHIENGVQVCVGEKKRPFFAPACTLHTYGKKLVFDFWIWITNFFHIPLSLQCRIARNKRNLIECVGLELQRTQYNNRNLNQIISEGLYG